MTLLNNVKEISPIFISGSVRSGTTIVTRALREVGIPGYDEGRFIDFMGLFLKLSERRYLEQSKAHSASADIMLKNVSRDEFERNFSEWFVEQYLKYCKYEGVWVDKTPNLEFLYAVKQISEIIPKSKFIFLKRRPIENIESRIKKFSHTDMSFEQHCNYWQEIMDKISSIQNEIPSDKYILIDQYEISKNPDQVANQIGLFLNLNFKQIEDIKNVFIKTRPESTGGNEDNIKSLEEMPWTEDQKKYFLNVCGSMTDKFGWSLEKKYYKD
jgi:hypothetical protein